MAKLTSNILEDAKTDLILKVTNVDIQGAKSKDPARCVWAPIVESVVRRLARGQRGAWSSTNRVLIGLDEGYIRSGVRSSPFGCPVARCLFVETGLTWAVYHSQTRMSKAPERIPQGGFSIERTWYDNSVELSMWLFRFDQGEQVEPIKLLIDHNQRTISISK